MNTKNKIDNRLISVSIFLLLIEGLWMLYQFDVLPSLSQFKNSNSNSNNNAAGNITKKEKHVKKRQQGSLIWENSDTNETIYFYDSILTLSQSTASIQLKENTEIKLSENTLIRIEPPEKNEVNQIRIQFSRGDLYSRNPYIPTQVVSGQWKMSIAPDSKVSIRGSSEKDFEVAVEQGVVVLNNDKKSQTLQSQELLNIKDKEISPILKVSPELRFQGNQRERYYVRQPSLTYKASWMGQADKIEMSRTGGNTVSHQLSKGETQYALNLIPGKYLFRLRRENFISEKKEVEVWEAPSYFLLKPFPRDRVYTQKSIEFTWTPLEKAKSYKIIWTPLDNDNSKIIKETKSNHIEISFDEEKNYQWEVISIDDQDYEIPSPYSNKIYPRHAPFPPPQLKGIQIEESANPILPDPIPDLNPEINPMTEPTLDSAPAPKTEFKLHPDTHYKTNTVNLISRFIKRITIRMSRDFLLQNAEAKEEKKNGSNNKKFKVVLNWDPIEGADLYFIEISSYPDFRSLAHSDTVGETQFIWNNQKSGIYYWRVAAGSSSGRMGLFSKEEKIILDSSQIKSNNVTYAPDPLTKEELNLSATDTSTSLITPTLESIKTPTPMETSIKAQKNPLSLNKNSSDFKNKTKTSMAEALSNSNILSQKDVSNIKSMPVEKSILAPEINANTESNQLLKSKPYSSLKPETLYNIEKKLVTNKIKKNENKPKERRESQISYQWIPYYSQKNYYLAEDLKVIIGGFYLNNHRLSYSGFINEDWEAELISLLHISKWKPRSAVEYPYQKNITHVDHSFSLLFKKPESHWQFGLSSIMQTIPERKNLEEIELSMKNFFGLSFVRLYELNKNSLLHFNYIFAINSNLNIHSLHSFYQYKIPFVFSILTFNFHLKLERLNLKQYNSLSQWAGIGVGITH